MHSVLVIHSLGPGGAERVLTQIAEHWAQTHRVTLVTLEDPLEESFYSTSANVSLLRLGKVHSASRIIRITTQLKRLRKAFKDLRPDRILSFIDGMNVAVLLSSLGLKIPVFVSERIDPHFHPVGFDVRVLRRVLYPLARKVIVQTSSAASFFPYLSNLTVIPNGIRPFSVLKESYRPTIGNLATVGRLDPQKNQILLVKAIGLLKNKYPNLSLTIYGEGPLRKELEHEISQLDLQNYIQLPGAIQNLPEQLINQDLFVFPSLYEGFPNALVEAMSLGLPVIASNCTGNRDVIQDGVNGLLFESNKPERLVGLIDSLLQSPPQAQGLGLEAKKVAKTYQIDQIHQKWDKACAI